MNEFMQAALEEARKGLAEGGVPIGSVLVHRSHIVGRGHNQRHQQGSVILHAEMAALEDAGRQPASFYREAVIYTTLSPCPMCSGAILLYGIPRIVIGENRSFLGDEAHLEASGVSLEVMDDSHCREIMKAFINEHPELWNEDIGE